MAKYGKTSRERLNTCHPDLQVIFEHVVVEFDNSILEGHRGQEDQDAYYEAGKSQVKYPDSKHNKTPSMAADAVPYPVDWNDIERFKAFGNYVCGVADGLLAAGVISHKLRWGGDWDYRTREASPQSFNDYPHFELVGD